MFFPVCKHLAGHLRADWPCLKNESPVLSCEDEELLNACLDQKRGHALILMRKGFSKHCLSSGGHDRAYRAHRGSLSSALGTPGVVTHGPWPQTTFSWQGRLCSQPPVQGAWRQGGGASFKSPSCFNNTDPCKGASGPWGLAACCTHTERAQCALVNQIPQVEPGGEILGRDLWHMAANEPWECGTQASCLSAKDRVQQGPSPAKWL